MCIEQGIDTHDSRRTAQCSACSAVLAELQRELIIANTRDGLAAARARGRVRRPPAHPYRQARLNSPSRCYDAGDMTVQQIAGLSPAYPGRRCTGTSTQTTPRPASRRRPLPRGPDGHLEIILGWDQRKETRGRQPER